MDPQMLLAALPWVRRGWKLLPPQARPFVLLVAAGVGIWYAVSGREQLEEMRERNEQQQEGGAAPAH